MTARRRDPRAERAASTVSTAPLRIDRSHRGGAATGSTAPRAAELAPVDVVEPNCLIFAVVEAPAGSLSRHDRQVLGAARRLDPGGGAVVMLAPRWVEVAGSAGADRLMILPETGYHPAAVAACITGAIERHAPRHVVFSESERGGDLARRVAAQLDEALFDNAENLSLHQAIRPACGRTREIRTTPPRLISIAPDMIASWAGPPHRVRLVEPPEPAEPAAPAPVSVMVAADPATIPLDQAPLVIAAGNGVTDFAAFLDLANAIGATPGASRVVCDAGRLPRALQVGASGTMLNADCYIALGISGAPQHLQGLGRVERIIAINTDLHAAMIARAGLAIVADAQAVMRALLERLT